jgi:hypothetical protein
MGRAIGERFETDPATFSMIAVAFVTSNRRFEFMFTGIASSILGKPHDRNLKLVLLLFHGEPLAPFRLCVF